MLTAANSIAMRRSGSPRLGDRVARTVDEITAEPNFGGTPGLARVAIASHKGSQGPRFHRCRSENADPLRFGIEHELAGEQLDREHELSVGAAEILTEVSANASPELGG